MAVPRSPAAREAWSGDLGFVLASVGSAVGIGNVWRFPHVAGTNGGGAFLLPYLAAVLAFALPLLLLEFALGARYRGSVVPALAAVRPRLRWAGLGVVALLVLILGYYLVITGWVLAYALAYLAGGPPDFAAFTASWSPFLAFLAAGALVLVVVQAGVRGGIERLSKVAIPLLFALLAVLAAFALTLPGAAEGMAFYLRPDLGRLGDPFVWTAAFGQAFFSLGVGLGVMLTYGSYAARGRLARSAAAVTAGDLAAALLGGVVVFPVVFTFGLDPAAGAQLAFVTLPAAFDRMPLGALVGGTFFVLLALAALTSAVSMLEVPVATLIDRLGWGRRRATLAAWGLVMLAGVAAALSYAPPALALGGARLLDLYDLWFGTFGIIAAGLVLAVAGAWLAAGSALAALDLRPAAQRAFLLAVRWLLPAALLTTLLARLARAAGGGA